MEHDGKLHIVVRLYSLVYNKRHLFYSNVMSVKCHVMSFTCDWCTKRHLSLKTIGAAWKHTTSSTVSKCQVPPLSSASDPAYCLNWKVWSSVYGRRLLKNCSKWQQVSNVQKSFKVSYEQPWNHFRILFLFSHHFRILTIGKLLLHWKVLFHI